MWNVTGWGVSRLSRGVALMPVDFERLRTEVQSAVEAHAPPGVILADLCRQFEQAHPETVAGVTMLDRGCLLFEDGIFPSLPNTYGQALRGIAVADRPGSCALAIFEGRTIECDDVMFDGRFSEGWRQLGLQHGLRALISIPARSSDGQSLGTFVVAHAPTQKLSDSARADADRLANLCGTLLEYRLSETAPH